MSTDIVVDTEKLIPIHPVRHKIYDKFHELLIKYNDTLKDKLNDNDVKKMALNIERGIFNYTLTKYNYNNQTTWNSFFQTCYINRCVCIYSNLNRDCYLKNINLIKRLFNKEFNEFELAFFTTKEIFPEQYQYLSEKYNLDKKEEENVDDTPDGMFKCRKCKSQKTSYYELQTRSADESATVYVTCHNCGNKWKF